MPELMPNHPHDRLFSARRSHRRTVGLQMVDADSPTGQSSAPR